MDKATLQKLVEGRLKDLQSKQDTLAAMWKPHLDIVEEYVKQTQDRELSLNERRNIAQCLENALDEGGIRSNMKLFEATTEDNISFLGIQLPVIAALLPSLTLNEFAITQALDRRIAAVFFLNVLYGSAKGGIAVGDNMMHPRTGHNRTETGRLFASTIVKEEPIASSAGASSEVTGTLQYAPGVDVTYKTIVIRDGNGDNIGDDSATAGTISGSNCTGTVTAAGAYALTPVSSWDSDGITIDYVYQYDLPVDAYNEHKGVPDADINITQETVRALDFPIRGRYSLGASIDLQKAHGINLENEVVKYLGGEVRFTIDHYGVDLIDNCSINGVVVDGVTQTPADPIGEWDATVGSGQEWLWKKHEFLKEIEKGNTNIIAKTLRALASYMICGNNVAALIKQMPGDKFKPASGINKNAPTGPYKLGELDGRPVIHDPLLLDRRISGTTVSGANRYILGWKGNNFLTSGFIYAPYIPLFATPTLITSDLFAQKGFLSSAAFKVTNAGMFTYGTITGY